MNKIGEEIKKARKRAGLSQSALASKLGVSASLISQYETGVKKPKLQNICLLSDALNIKPVVLISRSIDWESIKFETDDFEEVMLINSFRELNSTGKKEALKRVQELTEIDRYKFK